MTFLLLILFAHAVADFLLQTDKILEQKMGLSKIGFLKHGIAVYGVTFLFIHIYGLQFALYFSLIITLCHIFIDYIKIKIEAHIREKSWGKSIIVIMDQIIHIYCAAILSHFLNSNVSNNLTAIYKTIFPFSLPNSIFSSQSTDRILVTIICYLFVLFGGAVLTKNIIGHIFNKEFNKQIIINPATNNAGKYIGILERAIILTLIIYDSIGAVALVFTAKSIARFSELRDKDFAEYYIVGTLISLLISITGGLFLKKIFGYLV